jgi:hypothetical protein
VQDSTATCAAGSVAISGGWDWPSGSAPPFDFVVPFNRPTSTGAWTVIMVNYGSVAATFRAVAVCAKSSGSASVAPDAADATRSAQLDATLTGVRNAVAAAHE